MLEAAWISDTSDQIHTFAPPLAFHVSGNGAPVAQTRGIAHLSSLSDFGLVIIIWAMLSTVGIL